MEIICVNRNTSGGIFGQGKITTLQSEWLGEEEKR
jgi:hypothetical protein